MKANANWARCLTTGPKNQVSYDRFRALRNKALERIRLMAQVLRCAIYLERKGHLERNSHQHMWLLCETEALVPRQAQFFLYKWAAQRDTDGWRRVLRLTTLAQGVVSLAHFLLNAKDHSNAKKQ
jgi:hypothetical protein